jgi:hypothetical protein
MLPPGIAIDPDEDAGGGAVAIIDATEDEKRVAVSENVV